MGVTGALALAANSACLLLLTRHRDDDLNMRSTWLCSRNDIIANLGIVAAAAAVFATGSMWPDLAVGLLITAVFMRSAVYVVRLAVNELRHPATVLTWPVQPLALVLKNCTAGICPTGSCRCGIGQT